MNVNSIPIEWIKAYGYRVGRSTTMRKMIAQWQSENAPIIDATDWLECAFDTVPEGLVTVHDCIYTNTPH